MQDLILALDEARAVRILAQITDSLPAPPAPVNHLIDALGEAEITPSAANHPHNTGALARLCLVVLLDNPNYTHRIEVLLKQPIPERFFDIPTLTSAATIITMAIAVLQTKVRFVATQSSWKVELTKEAMDSKSITALIRAIMIMANFEKQ